jgi:Na+/H+ antiporter NhaC
MKALDDILFGFLIFFALDRLIRLFSNAIVEPWAMKRTGNTERAENWKLFSEFLLLFASIFVVYRFRKQLHRFDTS